MDAIADVYGSSSSSEDASSSDEEENFETNEASLTRKRPRASADSAEEHVWKRSFPHVEGNWPSHVYVTINASGVLQSLCQDIIQQTTEFLVKSDACLVPIDTENLHLSLSRPFVLRFQQIDPFVDDLRKAMKWRRRFRITLGKLVTLVNDERTRSFLALQATDGTVECMQTIACVDKCMRTWDLPTYYQDPIVHVSIASALRDVLVEQLSHEQLECVSLSSVAVAVDQISVVIGNKTFMIDLL